MGRKSKNRRHKLLQVREPSGRPQRAGESEYAPTHIKRMRAAAMRGLRDEQWGSELGLMHLEGKLTIGMYVAGKWWRDMAARYRDALEAPLPSPKGLAFEAGSYGKGADPDSEVGKQEAEVDREAIANFREAHGVLLAGGLPAERYVRNLCEHNIRPLGTIEVEAVLCGLGWLTRWRELTSQRNSDLMADRQGV